MPSYPPTGDLQRFEVGLLEAGTLVSSVNVSLSHRCSKSDLTRRAADYKETFCYVFNDLKPDTNYGFKVKVFNRGESQASDWSRRQGGTSWGRPGCCGRCLPAAAAPRRHSVEGQPRGRAWNSRK